MRRCGRAICAMDTRRWRTICRTIAKIHAEKGSKKIFFKNFMDTRVNYVILPVAEKVMTAEDAKLVSGEGYLTAVDSA